MSEQNSNIAPMDVLSKEQKEYIRLKMSMDSMHKAGREAFHPNGSCQWVPNPKGKYKPEYVAEMEFYLLLEILNGEHDEWLQEMIDKRKQSKEN